jgi:hypothetical protein
MRILVDTQCPACNTVRIDTFISTREPMPTCSCGTQVERLWSFGAGVRADDIPGGLLVEHGLCNADGTPRRYYSWTEIKRECNRRGLARWTDFYEEDRTKDARVYTDWLQSGEAKRQRRDREEMRREGVRPEAGPLPTPRGNPERQAAIRRIAREVVNR